MRSFIISCCALCAVGCAAAPSPAPEEPSAISKTCQEEYRQRRLSQACAAQYNAVLVEARKGVNRDMQDLECIDCPKPKK